MSDRKKTAVTEIARRIFDVPGEGECIEVCPCGDFPENVLIHTPKKSDQDYFGPTRLSLKWQFAEELANAILAACKEAEKREHGEVP